MPFRTTVSIYFFQGCSITGFTAMSSTVETAVAVAAIYLAGLFLLISLRHNKAFRAR